jgi:L-cystine transport system permease protein
MASENIRGALNSVETGQFEAGYSIGMTRRQVLLRIVLPQAIPTAVPPLCSSLIGLIKGSSLCYMLMIMEVLNGTLLVASRSYKYLEAYIAAALIFWFLCICFEQLGRLLTKKINTYQKGIG